MDGSKVWAWLFKLYASFDEELGEVDCPIINSSCKKGKVCKIF
jgi:hypothetical protein